MNKRISAPICSTHGHQKIREYGPVLTTLACGAVGSDGDFWHVDFEARKPTAFCYIHGVSTVVKVDTLDCGATSKDEGWSYLHDMVPVAEERTFGLGVMIAVLIVGALIGWLISPGRAYAEEPDALLPYPITSTGDTVLQVNAPAKSWGIRKAARSYDKQIDGLTIRTSGDCATATMCVNVIVDWFDEAEMLDLSEGHVAGWLGLTTFPSGNQRVIYLNGREAWDKVTRHNVARHELGHVLGLGHHSGRGVMSLSHKDRTPDLSRWERTTLQNWYGTVQVSPFDEEFFSKSAAFDEPYGGCDEAWQAPNSAGAKQCRREGYFVRSLIVVDPDGWVVANRAPMCKTEDAPGPCLWNAKVRGNGKGTSFYVTASGYAIQVRIHRRDW